MRSLTPPGTLLVLCLLFGCSRSPPPCQAPPDCSAGYECLAFRCVPEGGEPVSPQSKRLLLLPTRIGTNAQKTLSSQAPLGPPEHHGLFLDFDLPKVDCSDVDAAFLLLDAAAPGQPLAEPARLYVRRISERWSRKGVGSGETPTDALPEAEGLMLSPHTARVDVTALVCRDLESAQPGEGFVVRASDVASPLFIATGLESGVAPRLELYLEAAPKGRKPAAAAVNDKARDN